VRPPLQVDGRSTGGSSSKADPFTELDRGRLERGGRRTPGGTVRGRCWSRRRPSWTVCDSFASTTACSAGKQRRRLRTLLAQSSLRFDRHHHHLYSYSHTLSTRASDYTAGYE